MRAYTHGVGHTDNESAQPHFWLRKTLTNLGPGFEPEFRPMGKIPIRTRKRKDAHIRHKFYYPKAMACLNMEIQYQKSTTIRSENHSKRIPRLKQDLHGFWNVREWAFSSTCHYHYCRRTCCLCVTTIIGKCWLFTWFCVNRWRAVGWWRCSNAMRLTTSGACYYSFSQAHPWYSW